MNDRDVPSHQKKWHKNEQIASTKKHAFHFVHMGCVHINLIIPVVDRDDELSFDTVSPFTKSIKPKM